MTALPSPVPHPLEEFPFDVPRWAHQALEWVVGGGWPQGDENATWDVADRWYALAADLAGPHDAAYAAANRIVAGYHGAGIAADGFLDAWHRLSGDENAPLNALLQIAQELGALVEECGRDIEAAKLEVWIELGIFLIELQGIALTSALTLGATAPAAGGLIAATRIAVQQIFDRLTEQLGNKSIGAESRPEPGGRTVALPIGSGTGPDAGRPGSSAGPGRSGEGNTARIEPGSSADPGRPDEGNTVRIEPDSSADPGRPDQGNTVRIEPGSSADPGRPDEGNTARIEPGGRTRRLYLSSPAASSSPTLRPGHPAPTSTSPGPARADRTSPGPMTSGQVSPSGPSSLGPAPRRPTSRASASTGAASLGPVSFDADSSVEPHSSASSKAAVPAQGRPARAAEMPVDKESDASERIGRPPASWNAFTEPNPATGARPAAAAPSPVERAHRDYAENQREDYLRYLATLADESRAKIRDLEWGAERAVQVGAAPRGVALRRQATQIVPIVAEIEDRIKLINSMDLASHSNEALSNEPGGWARIGADVGGVADGEVHTAEWSALTGDGGGRPIDQTRHYHVTGGLRRPSGVHQVALAEAMPTAGDGRMTRLADPRVGGWFELVNDGGPGADPTRGLNCLDGVLALFDTYLHARPRVAAPRTFDGYAQGDPDRTWGGEWDAFERVRLATGAAFQNLCPFVGAADPALAKPAVDTALSNLTNHLHNTGHGAYAFVLTDLEDGGCHAWVAVNQDGTILFLDPQVARISADEPLYTHLGSPAPANIVSMDALVVDGQGVPAPLPYHGPGQWPGPANQV